MSLSPIAGSYLLCSLFQEYRSKVLSERLLPGYSFSWSILLNPPLCSIPGKCQFIQNPVRFFTFSSPLCRARTTSTCDSRFVLVRRLTTTWSSSKDARTFQRCAQNPRLLLPPSSGCMQQKKTDSELIQLTDPCLQSSITSGHIWSIIIIRLRQLNNGIWLPFREYTTVSARFCAP